MESPKFYTTFVDLSDEVWYLVKTWDSSDDSTRHIGNQMIRALDSIGANIREGEGRGYSGSLRQFWGYALGSALEACYWLERALVRKVIPMKTGRGWLKSLETCCTELETAIAGIENDRPSKR